MLGLNVVLQPGEEWYLRLSKTLWAHSFLQFFHNTQDYICTKWAYRRSWLSEALFCHHTCSKTALCYKHFWIAIRGVSLWREDATLASNNRRLFQITPGRLYTPLQIPREPAIWAINTLRNGSLPPLPNTLSLSLSVFVSLRSIERPQRIASVM